MIASIEPTSAGSAGRDAAGGLLAALVAEQGGVGPERVQAEANKTSAIRLRGMTAQHSPAGRPRARQRRLRPRSGEMAAMKHDVRRSTADGIEPSFACALALVVVILPA